MKYKLHIRWVELRKKIHGRLAEATLSIRATTLPDNEHRGVYRTPTPSCQHGRPTTRAMLVTILNCTGRILPFLHVNDVCSSKNATGMHAINNPGRHYDTYSYSKSIYLELVLIIPLILKKRNSEKQCVAEFFIHTAEKKTGSP